MTFLNPLALIGLVAAGIPVLLHLLNLRKVRVIEFSTLSFLKELQPTTLRRLRIRQILLLILRTLLIILLVVAFSRPTLKGAAASPLGTRVKTTAVIAMDDSPSMERHDRNGSLWSQATAAAQAILEHLEDGDEVFLLPFSASSIPSDGQDVISYRSVARARTALGDLKPGTISPTISRVLSTSEDILAETVNAQRELYLLSDFQEGLFSKEPIALEESESRESKAFQTYAVRIGEESNRNLGITGARVVNSIVEQGKPFTIAVTLTNSSPEDVDNSVVSVFLNGSRVTAKAVDVAAGTSPTFDIPVVAGEPGFINGTVSLDDDDFPFDNTRHFCVHLRRELRVVLIGPTASLRYLRTAIGTRAGSGPTVRVEESTTDRLSASLLRSADVLILANVSSLTASQVAEVSSFLKAGGGMLLFPGPLSDARSYQALSTSLGLPDVLGLRSIPRTAGGADESAARFEEIDRRHPLFQHMFQPRIGGERESAAMRLESPEVWTHVQFGPPKGAQVVVSLTDGAPFLVDCRVDAGRVMVFAVEAEANWSDLPHKGLFVPLLLRSVSYVAQEQAIMAEVRAGAPPPTIDRVQVHGPLVIHTPQGNTIAVPTLGPQARAIPLATVTDIGIYDVTEGPSTATRFVVNGAPEESLLRNEEPDGILEAAERAGMDKGFVHVVDDPGTLAKAITEARLGAELWHIAIIAALIIAVLELMLARATRREVAGEHASHPSPIPSPASTRNP